MSGSTPRGVWTYFSLVTRLTVDSCMLITSATSRSVSGLRYSIALLEEVALPVHDEVHHLEHGLAALLDGLNHPVGAVHLGGDELAVLRGHLLLVAGDLLIGPAQPEPRHAGVVEEDLVAAADLVDDQVGDDVAVALVGVLEAGLGVEPGQLVGGAPAPPPGSTPNRLARSFQRWAMRSGKASATSR